MAAIQAGIYDEGRVRAMDEAATNLAERLGSQ
jgi:hypothetical protein